MYFRVHSDDLAGLSGGVPPLHHCQTMSVGPPSAGQQRGMSIPHVVSECPGGVVIQQGVHHTVRRRQTQRHRHGPLQCHCDVTLPAAANSVQVH